MSRNAAKDLCRRHHSAALVFTQRNGMDADGGRRLLLRLASQDTPLP